ncbi:MAG: hypothetical protein ACFE7R_10125 [Candidatus Hodarchaeota archaeon]
MRHTRDDDSAVKLLRIGKAYGRYFLLSEEEEKDLILIQIARAYGKYFNSPKGKTILSTLKEGEELTLKFEDELLKVTKYEGKAVVEAMKINQPDSLFRYNPT